MQKQTKKFVIKSILFVSILCIASIFLMHLSSWNDDINSIFSFLSNSEDYVREEEEVKTEEIAVTQETNGYDKLIVGDSVSYFLFNRLQPYNQEYLLDGTNRPFTIAGQYVQIKEFIDAHENVTDVYMFESKDTWEALIDPQCGYQNVVVPMIKTQTLDELDENTRQEIQNTFTKILLNPFVVNVYMYSNMNHKIILNGILLYNEKILGQDVSALFQETDGQVSPIAQQYLYKIISLCEERNIRLHIVHDPLADNEQRRQEVELERQMFEDIGMGDSAYIEEYFSSILYYPEENFFDGTHFNIDDELQNNVIKDIQKVTKELNGIAFE